MGIRINKRLGYGLPIFTKEDDRVKWENITFEALEKVTDEQFRARVSAWCGAHPGWDRFGFWNVPLDRIPDGFFTECVTLLDEEASLSTPILLLTPPSIVRHARRRDDLIDYMEYVSSEEYGSPKEGKIQFLDEVPYPHRELVVEKDTLVPVLGDDILRLRKSGERSFVATVEEILEDTSFSTVHELVEGTRVLPPADVIMLAVGLDVFSDVEAIWELRQMIVTTWE